MFCTKCGKEIKDDSLFCIGCGAPVPPEKRAESAASTEGGSAAAAKKPVNKTLIILAVMIAVFFLIIFAFFSIIRGMQKKNDEPSLPDEQQVAAELPFMGFAGIDIGDRVVFGKYEQDGNRNNGAEPLEWDVIGKKDGKYMLITHYVIDYMQFDNGMADTGVNAGGNALDAVVTWEKCSLRQWLNSEFYSETFTDEERGFITPVKNYNADWLEFDDNRMGASNITTGGYGGNVTDDKVFLLSAQEVQTYLAPTVYRTEYSRNVFPSAVASATMYVQSMAERGVCWTMDKAFGSAESRSNPNNAWRKYYEGYVDTDYMEKEALCCWFTRSPGCYKENSAEFTVMPDGSPQPGILKSEYAGVRPVVWVTP